MMNENELIILSFCKLLQSQEDGMYIKPFLDCEFTEDTKGIVFIRSNTILEENSVLDIKVNNQTIWTSNIRKIPSNINYFNEDNYLNSYISEKVFLSRNIVDGINIYCLELRINENIIGQANFQASIQAEDDYPKDNKEKDSNVQEREESVCDKDTGINDNLHDDTNQALNNDIFDDIENLKIEDAEINQSSNLNNKEVFSTIENLNLNQLVEYKEIIKHKLDNLIEKTQIIYNENYFSIISSPNLMEVVKEIDDSKKVIEDKMEIVLSFYNKSYDYIQNSIENEKISIAKKLLDNGLDEKTICDIMNLNAKKFN